MINQTKNPLELDVGDKFQDMDCGGETVDASHEQSASAASPDDNPKDVTPAKAADQIGLQGQSK